MSGLAAAAGPHDDLDHVGDAAAEAVEAPDDEGVAGAKGLEEPLELGALTTYTRGVLGVDPLATGLL